MYPEYLQGTSCTACAIRPSILTKLPQNIIMYHILPQLDPFDGLIRFVQAYEHHSLLGPVTQKYLFDNQKLANQLKETIVKLSPKVLLKKLRSIPIFDTEKTKSSLYKRFSELIAGLILDTLWNKNTTVSTIDKESGIWHRKSMTIQEMLAAVLRESPEKLSVIYIKEAKLLLPDSYHDPIKQMKFNRYMAEFNCQELQGHRRMAAIGGFILASVYTFDITDMRVRIFSSPNYNPYHDMANEDEFMGTDLWDEYANFEEPSFWHRLSCEPSHSSRLLIANAMCTKMDLASALYHNATKSIEMYGLKHATAYSHFDREEQIDWRMVGYAIMANESQREGANKVTLSAEDIYGSDGTIAVAKPCKTPHSKIVKELVYSGRCQDATLIGFNCSEEQADDVFNKTTHLQKITVINKRLITYYRNWDFDYENHEYAPPAIEEIQDGHRIARSSSGTDSDEARWRDLQAVQELNQERGLEGVRYVFQEFEIGDEENSSVSSWSTDDTETW